MEYPLNFSFGEIVLVSQCNLTTIMIFSSFSITCLCGTVNRINFTVKLQFPANIWLETCIQRSCSDLMKDVTLRQFILTGASLSVNIYWFCCISLYKNDNKLLLHPRKKQRHTKYLPIVYKHRRSN